MAGPMTRVMKLRLESEYNELRKVPQTKLYDWAIAPGETIPYVSSYLVTYHIRTLVKKEGKLEWQNDTTVCISKSAIDKPWAATVKKGAVPYHPNWWPSGNVCVGNGMDDPEMWLYEAINFVGKLLQFQPDVINPRSPANGDANTYWLAHKNDVDRRNGRHFFPTDSTVFPIPGARGEAPKPQIIIKKKTVHNS